MIRALWSLGAVTILLSACAVDDPSVSEPDDPRDPESYLPDLEVAPPEATLDDDGVATHVVDAFQDVITYVPAGFPTALDELMALGQPGCPAVRNLSEGRGERFVWEADCVTDTGVSFQGSIDFATQPPTVDKEGFTNDRITFYTPGMRITTRDGRFLEAAGYFTWNHRTRDDGIHAGGAYMDGVMYADDATAGDDPWLSGQVEGLLAIYLGQWGDYRYAVASGAIATRDPDVVALNFEDLVYEPGACDVELFGRASLREANGVWHDLSFAYREDTDEAAVMECDGCAAHLVSGAPQEQDVCISTRALDAGIDFSGGLPW